MTEPELTRGLVASQEFFSTNIIFIAELYQKFLQDEASIDASWVEFFKKNSDEIKAVLADYNGPSWAKRDLRVVGSIKYDMSSNAAVVQATVDKVVSKAVSVFEDKNIAKIDLNLRVANLILAYQRFGHLAAHLDPLELTMPRYVAEIDYKNHGITPQDLEKTVELNGVLAFEKATISQVIDRLNRLYTGFIGSEFEYIFDQKQKAWLTKTTAQTLLSELSCDEKIKILQEVIRTERFEQFLHKRFPGAKRFSIEGGDAMINAIEKIIDVSAGFGMKKVIIGMAHRGRLNTLTGIMKKPYHQMIAEFKGTPGLPEGVTKSGDVKYHMGYSSMREIDGKKIDLSLAFNPSHLEAVDSVVTGRVRATQDLLKDKDRLQSMALLIHGDAAFAGQGSVAEGLIMNGVKGYDTGGVIHIIVNNQIGFTANPQDSRSTLYASDLAKSIDAPIFHVNGDDVEAVVKIAKIAAEFRQNFKKDVVIDIIFYRRYGHNEGDEPLYTQPVMYTKIKSHPTLEKIYSKQLLDEGAISAEVYKKIVSEFDAELSREFDLAASYKPKDPDWLHKDWTGIENGDNSVIKTALATKKLQELVTKILVIPKGFNANPKIVKQLEARKDAVVSGKDIDWGCAESLAFA
ncbi:MAG TPA: thiamine pyrophosphate-dependent enzyme, partial [Rickettsiales bacterium]|nr:thiamine pyrophosphate-dependent enzyme [Rickettsiales bacterium]